MKADSEIDFSSLCEPVARIVWGEPSNAVDRELRWGTHGSKSLDRTAGVWFDHEIGEGGGTLDLVPGDDKTTKLQWLRQHGLIASESNGKGHGGWTFIRGHVYHKADGTPHVRKRKMLDGIGKRQFPQEHWDGHQWVNGIPKGWPRHPYRLPELTKSDSIIYVTEGEADADSLAALGFTATTAGSVSSKWTPELVQHFHDRRVVVFVDADQPGREYGKKVAKALFKPAKSVKVVDLFPERDDGADVTDWLKTDTAAVKLMALVRDAPDFVPGADAEPVETSAADMGLIAELAGLDPLAYARRKQGAAKKLKIGITELDKLVAAERSGGTEPELLFDHWTVEPSAKDVATGELLEGIIECIHRHVVLTRDQAIAVALWVVLSWVHEAAAVHSPILLVTSAEANSGKSTLLGIVGYLARRALLSVSISGPALFRSIEKWQPTFVIDEADAVFRNNEDLREVINSGWTRGQSVIRCDPNTQEPRTYSTFAPKALGMKGKKIPDTTMSRSIIIEMKRKRLGEEVQDFSHVDNRELAQLRRRLTRWANDNAVQLSKATPETPAGFHNRVRANWKLLLAIAETAGPDWAKAARQAAEKLAGAMDAASIGIEMLTDIRTMFIEKDTDRLASAVIADTLAGIEGRRWAEWGKSGKPITANGVARILAQFQTSDDIPIAPGTKRAGKDTFKGYYLTQFLDAFARYLPDTPFPTVTPSQPNNDGHFCDFTTVTPKIDVTVVKCEKPNNDGHCDGVTVGKWGCGEKSAEKSVSDPWSDYPELPACLDRRPKPSPPPDDLCVYCGQPATPADPLTPWDGPDGRPVLLHAGCEAAFMGRE